MRLSLLFQSFIAPFAKRFIAGERAEDAIAAARRANAQGIHAILDFLGEDVLTEPAAAAAAQEYVTLLGLIAQGQVRASVSLKVSQMGIRLSREVCLANLRRVLEEAVRRGLFVWIDMEGSDLTQKTLDVFSELRQTFVPIGLCLQAALVRTGSDIDALVRAPALTAAPLTLRLCKGAYKESAQVAYTTKSAVDGHFRMLVQKVMDHAGRMQPAMTRVYPAFATHDPALLQHIQAKAQESQLAADQFEFQMLYGIQNQRLAQLVKDGFRGTVYIPYGTHWFPYFTRRLRERKENLYFLLRNIIHR